MPAPAISGAIRTPNSASTVSAVAASTKTASAFFEDRQERGDAVLARSLAAMSRGIGRKCLELFVYEGLGDMPNEIGDQENDDASSEGRRGGLSMWGPDARASWG